MEVDAVLVLLQLFGASAELIFKHLPQNHTLDLSCPAPQDRGQLTGVHLYHRGARGQVTLASLGEDGGLRVHPGHRGRLLVSGGPGSARVNVSVSGLTPGDSGLYVCELSFRETGSDLNHQEVQVVLLVQETTVQCSCSVIYSRLLTVVFTAVLLLLILLGCLLLDRCMKPRVDHSPLPAPPIYEEMTRKQQSGGGIPQTPQEAPPHPEEHDFPIYTNPSFRQPQDNYYASPRQLSRAHM